MRSPKDLPLSSERHLVQKMSELISLRERVAQAELDASHFAAIKRHSANSATEARTARKKRVLRIGRPPKPRAGDIADAAGVEFIDENGGGAGVRLRRPSGKKS